MKFPLKPRILPLFTLGTGGIGLSLHIWLFRTGIDEKGLLVSSHPAATLLFVLSALVLAVLFLTLRPVRPISKYTTLFPPSVLNAVGCALGAGALLYTSIAGILSGTDIFARLLVPLGIAAAAVLVYTAFCRYKGLCPQFYLSCIPTVYMMLRLIAMCRKWGTEPQMLQFFFPLMACVFLLLTCYQHNALILRTGRRMQFLFCSQSALFFCCLSFNTEARIFFLGMAAWMATDLCALHQPLPKAPAQEA